MYESVIISIGAAITAGLLAAAHLKLWRIRMTLVVRYTIGVSGIGAGLSLALLLLNLHVAVVAFWAVSGAAGITIGLLHLWRERRGDLPRDIEDAYADGKLAQYARGEHHGAPGKF